MFTVKEAYHFPEGLGVSVWVGEREMGVREDSIKIWLYASGCSNLCYACVELESE